MATAASPESLQHDRRSTTEVIYDFLEFCLSPLASLKLTVVLFAFSLAIIFFGTLAQTEMTILEVKKQFFETYICYVPLNSILPKSFFPGRPDLPYGFFMPGGATIGALLLINLLSAHVIRFKVRARGTNLAIGLIGVAIGGVITFVVILGGHNRDGIQGLPWFDWGTLWLMLKLSLVAFWFLAVYAAIQLYVSKDESEESKVVELSLMGTAVVTLTALIAYLLYAGDAAALSDSSMRILWQLIQGTLCGVALLFGAIYLFNQRAGIVVMHFGVGLLMVSELLVSLTAVEQQMMLYEGESISYARDIRTTELAFVLPGAEKDAVTVVPRNLLEASFRDQSKITNDSLPVDVIVRDYMPNSDIEDGSPGENNPSNVGAGKYLIAQSIAVSGGADASGSVDLPSAYVEFFEKGGDKSLGVYMLSTLLTAQEFEDELKVGDKTYNVALRFKRTYKPYRVTLLETERVNYEGTSKAKHYLSRVRVVDEMRDKTFEKPIWMNNPLRYAGETFYQSGHDFDRGREFSILQIVTNLGWMIPYVSCMIVAVGMFYHFGLSWRRFLSRREESNSPLDFMRIGGPMSWLSAVLIVAVLAGYSLRRTEKLPETAGMDLKAFSSLPVLYEGRVQPVDTLARNTLKIVSDRESVTLPKDEKDAKVSGRSRREDDVKVPAIVWFLEVVSDKPEAGDMPIFRIDLPEIQKMLALKRRKGHRFTLNELLRRSPEGKPYFTQVEELANEARKAKDKSKLTVLQRRCIELTRRTRAYMGMVVAFRSLDGQIPDRDYAKALVDYQQGNRDQETLAAIEDLQFAKQAADLQEQQLMNGEPPLMVPDASTGKWTAMGVARNHHMFMSIMRPSAKSPAGAFSEIMKAYRNKQGGLFNKYVDEYRSQVVDIDRANLDKLDEAETKLAALEKQLVVLEEAQASSDTAKREEATEQITVLHRSRDKLLTDVAAFKSKIVPAKLEREASFSRQDMFTDAMVLYLLAFLCMPVAYAFAIFARPNPRSPNRVTSTGSAWTNRLAFLLVIGAFLIHSLALTIRMNLSGRPPVTNLYSSAIFIGWGCVLLGIALELFFRYGVGNMVGAVAGFSTLIIANILSGDGDTMKVLVAVLDTQFWLATHVVCITLGYATTFLAGLIGTVFIIGGVFTPALSAGVRRDLTRMTYAIICFSIFFSFVGTVLGGLWADDSWGRFWGWDPKENGALMIVVWNALVLHARWGGMIKERGMAVLSVFGMVVTAWSWFGVNELGVGLHSYGFTDGVLLTLGICCGVMLLVMGIGMIPRRWWISNNIDPPVTPAKGA